MAIAQDMRKFLAMTKADALVIFYRLARIETKIRKNKLAEKERILKIKEEAEARRAELQKEYDSTHRTLTEYLKAHKERFIKPRKEKIDGVGSFGWEKDEGKVETIEGEEEKIKTYSDQNGLTLYSIRIIPDKVAILKALESGHKVPGVDYTPKGDNPKISFSKSIDETRIPEE